MTPYFIFLIISLLLAYLAYRRQRTHFIFIILLYTALSLFAGLRSAEVGTDTSGYARGFEDLFYLDEQVENEGSFLTEEPGFYYLQKWLGQVSNEYYVLLTGIALVFCFFVMLSIGKQSRMPILSFFVFITLGYYTFVFNAARQGIAMSIYMISIPYIIERKFWKYTFVVLFAALFHKSIVIAIPLYFFFTIRFSPISIVLALIGGVVISISLPALLNYGATLETRYALYSEGNATGGYLLTAFYVVLTLFFALQRKTIKEEALPVFDVYLNMLIVGSAVYLIVTITGAYVELTRFAAYFQISSVFLWPMLITDRSKPLPRQLLVLALLGHLGFFAIFLTKMANLTPYMFNPTIINGIL